LRPEERDMLARLLRALLVSFEGDTGDQP